jgi:putative hydrolase of the HAD superfamily
VAAISAIGFDLGETLLTYADTPLNWSALYPAAPAKVAEHLGVAPTASQQEEAAGVLARYNTRLHPRREEIAAGEIFREVFASWSLTPGALERATAAFFEFFQQRLARYPETSRVLRELQRRGIRVGVLTDVPYGMPRAFVERDLRGAELLSLTDELLTSVEVGWRKPEAAGFRLLAAKLGVAPRELWFVGNEEKDIAGALVAGAKPVLIDREGRAPEWGQAHTLRDLGELLPLIS